MSGTAPLGNPPPYSLDPPASVYPQLDGVNGSQTPQVAGVNEPSQPQGVGLAGPPSPQVETVSGPPLAMDTHRTPTDCTTVVAPIFVVQQMGPKQVKITCKSCNNQIITKIKTKATTRTHVFACILCLIGCWCCVCVPYCIDSCNNADHYCPECGAYIGSYVN